MSMDLVVATLHTRMDSSTDKLVMVGLAEHAWSDGTHCYPSVERLALYGSMNRATVQRSIKRLITGGWIEVVKAANQHTPTWYQIVVARLQGPQIATPELQGPQSVETGAALRPPGAALSHARGRAVRPEPKAVNQDEPTTEPLPLPGPPADPDLDAPDLAFLKSCPDPFRVQWLSASDAWVSLKDGYPRIDLQIEASKYLAWWRTKPKSEQHRNLLAGFRKWVAKSDRWAQQRAEEKSMRTAVRR